MINLTLTHTNRRREPHVGDDDDGNTPYEDRDEAWKALVTKLAELMVHFGLFNAVMESYPETVQEGFLERINSTIETVDTWIEELQTFGSAFDDE